MTRPERGRGFWQRYRAPLLFTAVVALGTFLYTAGLRHNPPGFFVDESSVAYNAYTVSRTGRDEFGEEWPLFFRAFGDYKNPVYVYLLAALFKLFGPGILTARLLSAFAGALAAALMGLLAARVSKRREVGLLVAASALLTPWLFEMSRVVLEVALYPLAVALFLLCVRRGASKDCWSWRDAAFLAASLALLTYTYSVGRLLAPMLALGLVIFYTRARRRGILLTWALYAPTLLPMLVFQRNHADALTGRFNLITYITPQSSYPEIAWEFVKHYAGNLDPRRLLFTGDPGMYQVAHVQGTPAVLVATLILALAGAWFVARRHRNEAWWRFVVYGLLASVVPASLTADYFHMLRLAAMPVFLLVLTVPAFAWLCEEGVRRGARRAALLSLLALTLLQGALFQWEYHASERDAWRRHMFDADYPQKIFDAALANGARPVYLADAMTTPYIQAYWYATLRGVPLSEFVRLAPDESPPAGAVVISTEESCSHKRVLAQTAPYTLYVADAPRGRAPLPDGAFRASLSLPDPPAKIRAGEKGEFGVRVKNDGNAVWPGCERSAGRFQTHLAGRWLDDVGRAASKEEGRTPLPSDLAPGEETRLTLGINAPTRPGEYVLELDMVQEGVSWFGLKGSTTTKLRVRVE
ncbi:MAG: glycosyltransferase family 39 protein [Rubrivivax sp.]|nr:glycosyltransferase family 39 protein [Pyrinomonadaceae bacterium]